MDKKKIIALLAVAIVFWASIATWAIVTQQQGSGVDPLYPSVHGDIYMQAEYFVSFQGDAKVIEGKVSGAILPHPRQNPNGTAEALASLAASDYGSQIVLVIFASAIGSQGITGDYSWQTPFGIVSTTYNHLQYLLSAGVEADNQRLGAESDLGLMMIYLKFYLGDSIKVTPLVLDEDSTVAELQATLSGLMIDGENSTLLVVPPYTEKEKSLPFSDNLAWADILAPGGGILAGYLQDNAIRGLAAAEALLPTDQEQILTLFYNKNAARTEEYFSDLLIFYGNEE